MRTRGGRLVLIYSAITSLDGYTADQEGKFDWAEPDEELMALINDLERPVGTYLYGRRMYEVLRYWEDADLGGRSAATREFAGIWRSADKVVYSSSLRRPPALPRAHCRLIGHDKCKTID
jgi:dihydrofolate reductase